MGEKERKFGKSGQPTPKAKPRAPLRYIVGRSDSIPLAITTLSARLSVPTTSAAKIPALTRPLMRRRQVEVWEGGFRFAKRLNENDTNIRSISMETYLVAVGRHQ